MIENQRLSPLINLLKKPQAIPLLLSLFLLLTWISLRLQHSSQSHVSSSSSHPKSTVNSHPDLKVYDDDDKANLVRFGLASLSPARKDDRGWLLDPVILARDSELKGSDQFLRMLIRKLINSNSYRVLEYIETEKICSLNYHFHFLPEINNVLRLK